MLIFGANADGAASEYNPKKITSVSSKVNLIPKKGSYLNLELNKRLLPKEGCKNDGKSPFNSIISKDLVLNLYEWTFNLSNTYIRSVTPDKYETYNPVRYTMDHVTLSFPVMVYLASECEPYVRLSNEPRNWKNLKIQSNIVSNNLKKVEQFFQTNMIFQQLSKGQY